MKEHKTIICVSKIYLHTNFFEWDGGGKHIFEIMHLLYIHMYFNGGQKVHAIWDLTANLVMQKYFWFLVNIAFLKKYTQIF